MAILVVLAAGGGLWWYFTQRPLVVPVAVLVQDVPVTVFGLGAIEARVLSRVGFEMPGTLVEVTVDHGDRLAVGAVLARLNPASQEARVARADAVDFIELGPTHVALAQPREHHAVEQFGRGARRAAGCLQGEAQQHLGQIPIIRLGIVQNRQQAVEQCDRVALPAVHRLLRKAANLVQPGLNARRRTRFAIRRSNRPHESANATYSCGQFC